MEYLSLTNGNGQINCQQSSIKTNEPEYTTRMFSRIGKKSLLINTHGRNIKVSTDSIAFFYVKHGSTVLVDSNLHEYPVKFSLVQLKHLLPEDQFFHLNRQCLINSRAINAVACYLTQKLLVKLKQPAVNKLQVFREKTYGFLRWLENRWPVFLEYNKNDEVPSV